MLRYLSVISNVYRDSDVRDSAVVSATRYGMDGPETESRCEGDF